MVKYIDADVLVYWATDHAKHGETATKLLKHIELNEKGVTSALSLYLFDSVLERLGIDDYEFGTFVQQLGKLRNLKVEPLGTEHLRRADPLRRELEVPLDVAVGLVVAKDKRADGVYSNNPAFDRGPLPRKFAEP